MQKFTQGFLPSSFDDVWISNKIRRAGQDQVELRNNDDINIPFARLCSTQRQPLSGFPQKFGHLSPMKESSLNVMLLNLILN